MDLQQIDIAAKNFATLVCSRCGNSDEIAVSKLLHYMYKVRCKCMYVFLIGMNRRRYARKKTNFIGTYSLQRSFTNNIISVVDLSREGLGFIRTDQNLLNVSDKRIVSFTLDNREKDIIECTVSIKNIFNNKVCAEFVDMKGTMRKTLGFYLF